MQYVNVIVNSKTDKINQVFTYEITPELLPGIKPGVLVEVPFGRKYKEGIVLDIKRQVNFEVQTKLKSIKKIIDPIPIIDTIRLELAKWMSRYYLTSLAKVIFFMVPDVARRLVTSNKRQATAMSFRLEQSSMEKSLSLRDSSTSLIYARNDKYSRIFGLYNTKENRIKNYIKLIQKARAKNRGVILLFPDWKANQVYIDTIYERFINDTVLLDPHKTKTEFFQSWNELRMCKKSIVIGTRNSIFAPVNNLGLIIIDEPEDFGYKEEQTVHYHVREVSKHLAKITGVNLIYGSSIPQLTDYYWQKSNKIKIIQHSNVLKNVRMLSKILIIDSSQEKLVVGYQLEQKINNALKDKQKILIFVNRKQQGFLCADCGNIFRCPRCNNVLQYRLDNLTCSQCNYKTNPTSKCPECLGHNLRSFGTSIESIKKELTKLFPKENRIIISTNEIFRYPELKFDLVIISSWEHLQFGGDFNQKQNIINTIIKLLEITKNNLIIQTNNLENELLQNIKGGKLDTVYERELLERKKYHYPPFYKLVKFIYKHKDSKIAEKEISKLYQKLKGIFRSIEILGPSETRKLRDKIYWQIVLKIPVKFYPQVNKLLISREKELNLSKYLIDADPLRLI